MSATAEILFARKGRAGLVTLNRPKALNALTWDMVLKLHAQLREWEHDDAVERVIVTAAGDRAFCAGGDIRALYDWGRAGDPKVLQFYRDEYPLNRYIKRYPKPYIAIIDGIVMGGGVGVSVHGSHRIGTENTQFAMPETGIGLFPDVGGTYFLPRLPGKVGTYLALTGARLGQGDALEAGVLTHAVQRDDVPALIDRLCETEDLDAALAEAGETPPIGAVFEHRDEIDQHFVADTVESIIASLETGSEWAQKTAKTIRSKSPTSAKIALRQMQDGIKEDFEGCMQIEFRIVSRVVKGTEFYEGVRAVIIDKDQNPQWSPSTLEAVSDSMVDEYFAPLGVDELSFETDS